MKCQVRRNIKLWDADYRTTKLFLMSLPSRLGVTRGAELRSVDLGHHAETLRKYLLVGIRLSLGGMLALQQQCA